MTGNKAELRQKLRGIADSLSAERLGESDERICAGLLRVEEYNKADTVFFYYSVGAEPDTRKPIRLALEAGKTVAVPRITGAGLMEAAVIGSVDELVPGTFGIPTAGAGAPVLRPNQIDVIIVPAVAFDRRGYRLGRGGGYYDRYLKACPAFAIGLARSEMLIGELPQEGYDVPVDIVVTDCAQ